MSAQQENVKYIPTILSIFLAFNLLQFGILLVAQNGFNLLYDYTKISQITNVQEEYQIQRRIDEAISHFQSEFSLGRLNEEIGRAHLMRDKKIHYLAAVACGIISIIISCFAIFVFAKSWRYAWQKGVSSKKKLIFKAAFTSKLISWCTLVIGVSVVIVSSLALNKLIYYRDEAWFTAFMNYDNMTYLASHYRFTLILGIVCSLWGIVGSLFHMKKRI